MRIVVEESPPCPCNAKRFAYLAERQAAGFGDLWVGSVLECDCGTRYILNSTDGIRSWDIYVEAP